MDERKSKKILLVITILISFILISECSIVFAANVKVETQTPEFYVNDFADVFSEEQEQALMQKALDLVESYNGIQVVVTTIKSLEGSSPEEYAYTMYNQYGIGKDSMGILILLATEDREVRIETGQKMQMYITDSLCGRILDKYGIDYLKDNKFAEGLISVQDATINEIKERVTNNWYEVSSKKADFSFDFGSFMLKVLMFVVLPAGVIVLVIFAVKKVSKAKKAKIQSIISENDEKWNKTINEKENNWNYQLEKVKQELSFAKISNNDLESRNDLLLNELDEMNNKYERIKKLHPNIESEIYQMIQNEFKDEAKKYDSQYSTLLETKPSAKNKERFSKAIEEFENLPSEVKKYTTLDIKELKKLYNDCVYLEDDAIAGLAHAKVSSFLHNNPKVDYKNYLEFAKVFAVFAGLTSIQKQYFANRDTNLIERLNNIKETAKSEYEDYNLAKKVEDNMSSTIESIYSPDRYDIDDIKEEIDKYESLTQNQKSFIPTELYEKLKKMLKKAQQDEDDYQSRRRMSSISRPSSSTSSRSFSGFGGRSGGGGAGRGF